MQAEDLNSGTSCYAEATQPLPERPRLTFDLDVDVCVVGGGFAGLTAAREIARRGWSVALLEAQTVGWGASGRNLGFVLPGFQETIGNIVERVGVDHARELWALSERGLDYVRDTIRDTGMPGVEPVNGWLSVSKFRDDEQLSAQATLLWEKFGAQVEIWSTEQVRRVLASPLYHNAIHFPRAFHIHPLNYALGLAAAAEQAGVRIFEHTPALSLDPSGIRKRIGTPSARVRSAQIVLAGNSGLASLVPRLAASLLPVTSFVALTEPLGDTLHDAVAFKGGVSDSETVDNHYRIIDGNRLLWSGGQSMWSGDPGRYRKRLAADIRRAYPQLGRVAVEHVWSGTGSVAVHSMPQIGEIARGLWIANGFAGHGLNTTAMAGELIARGLTEGDETWRLFSPYDLVWAGGAAGRIALQLRHVALRTKERIDAVFLADDVPVKGMPAEAYAADATPAAAVEKARVAPAEQPAAIPAVPHDEPPAAPASEAAPAPEPAVAEAAVAEAAAAENPPAKPKKAARKRTTAPARKRAKKAAPGEAGAPPAPEKKKKTRTDRVPADS